MLAAAVTVPFWVPDNVPALVPFRVPFNVPPKVPFVASEFGVSTLAGFICFSISLLMLLSLFKTTASGVARVAGVAIDGTDGCV